MRRNPQGIKTDIWLQDFPGFEIRGGYTLWFSANTIPHCFWCGIQFTAEIPAGCRRKSYGIVKGGCIFRCFDLETVRLGFFLADIYDLQVCAGDIGNAFLYGWTKEKVYIIAGPEFEDYLHGKVLIIDKGLHGLWNSALRFHKHLAASLKDMGFCQSKADLDFWVRDAGDHYKYIAVYIDDVMVFFRDSMKQIPDPQKEVHHERHWEAWVLSGW